MVDQLLGPLGLLAGALVAVVALWRLVGDYINELRASRDRWHALATSYEAKFRQRQKVQSWDRVYQEIANTERAIRGDRRQRDIGHKPERRHG